MKMMKNSVDKDMVSRNKKANSNINGNKDLYESTLKKNPLKESQIDKLVSKPEKRPLKEQLKIKSNTNFNKFNNKNLNIVITPRDQKNIKYTNVPNTTKNKPNFN